jgi:hypothetical protein
LKIRNGILPARKVFLVKDQFVKLPAKPHTKDIREHHEREDIRHGEYVNTFLFIIFTMGASKSRSTLISAYSDIYHTKYGKNIISNSYAIDISLNIDTCHIAYGFLQASSNPLFQPSLENAIAPKNHQCHYPARLKQTR